MNTTTLSSGLLSCAVLALISCASVDSGTPAQTSGNFNDCFFARTLSDWRPLDDENLVLFAGRRNPYHVQLVRPAFGLDRDFMIGVYDRDGRVCPFGGDAIVVRGVMPESIQIRSMRRISMDELDQLYVDYGIRDPASVEVTPVEIIDDEAEANPDAANSP